MWDFLHRLFQPTVYGQQGTVRYAFPMVLSAALMLGLAAVVSDNSSYITIETPNHPVTTGQVFFITVKITAHTPVNAIDIALSYPENNLEIKSIDTGTSVITLWAEEPKAERGIITLRGGTFKRGFLGEHTVARIRVVAKEGGLAYVRTSEARLVAGDGLGSDVAVRKTGGAAEVTVTGESSTLVATGEVTIVTDIDGDGKVDIRDISAFMAAWFTREKTFDFNGDGRMTIRDFSILLADSFFGIRRNN